MQRRGYATTQLRRRPIRLPFNVGIANRPATHLCRVKRIEKDTQLQKFPPPPVLATGCPAAHYDRYSFYI